MQNKPHHPNRGQCFFLSPVSSIGHLVSTRPSIVRNTASELEKTLGGSDTLETLFTGAALESTGVPPLELLQASLKSFVILNPIDTIFDHE